MKTLLLGALAAAMVATAMPAPAHAQTIPPDENPAPDRRRSQPSRQAQAPASRADLVRIVTCQLTADGAPIDAVLATPPYSPQEATAVEALMTRLRQCNSGRGFSASVVALRAIAAEAALEARFPAQQAARSPELGVKPLLDVAAATARPDAGTLVTSYGMADCMAATQAGPVRALLAIEPGAPEEAAQFNNVLAPLLGRCVATVQGGTGNISIDGRTLRGILAESLYRWSVVQRDGPASPWVRP